VFGVLLFVVIFLMPDGAKQVALACRNMIGKLKKIQGGSNVR
jgi:branched-chain amino acid transport system permease protein